MPIFRDHPLHFTNMKDFLFAIEKLDLPTQAKLVSLMLLADYKLVNEPALQRWIVQHAHFISTISALRLGQ